MGQQGRSAGTPLTPEDPPAIGPYELISRLGSGGMGTVYLAKAADGVQVALKAIRRDYTTDPVYRARFHEEVSNARKVASFCTARVLDHGEHDGVLYLVTEYIEGISLENHLIEHGPLTPSVLHSAAVGVAAALTAIHAVGLVHRDLKPANVMLTLGGPRVIDFGLARSSHVSTRHTNAGMVMGTPGWIAPEQVFEGRTSPAGDVFAWGSLIAYAGLGGHPFGEGDAYVMAARARTAPPDLRGLPAPLDRLVAAAIHPDPARRPAAKQLLLELVGAADEPAAQLAATRHLSSSWNPSEFPPLAEFPNNSQVRQAPPGWSPPPQAHQPQPHQPSAQQPQAHQQTGVGPLPGRGPAPHPPAQAPPPPRQAPPRQAPPRQASPRQGSPRQASPPGPASQVPPSHQTGQMPPSLQTGQVPLSAHQTGQVPLPPGPRGPAGFPVKRKRSVFTGCVTAVVVAIVLFVLLLAVLVWALRSPDPVGADSPVQDGKLKFAVTGTKCPKPAKAAKQRTCQVSVKVNNVGQEARVLYPGQQKLLDEDDALHGGTKLLDKAGAEVTPVRIGPGQSFSGALLFELPKEAQPAGLELHDSGLSTGVRVRLD
ncbi:serine/threonine-protein kinase [Nonomuraea aurantiaca]|uniref:serine/threonine-protein kinase n=1 Tax=Nonomuraea aurantiaca TaxID=2878562 RepID=UPI001CD99507|nr:serine/threonine-protein kinase [Nonomuraea aurantiaca]MCA2225015.1 protein kinase [Nonomuraea aurantiaca]